MNDGNDEKVGTTVAESIGNEEDDENSGDMGFAQVTVWCGDTSIDNAGDGCHVVHVSGWTPVIPSFVEFDSVIFRVY